MRSLSEIACKRCNSNDGNSAFEAVVGELRATLLRRSGGVARVRIPHHARGRIRQNVDSFSHNRLSSPFFTQWVCTLVATPPQTTPAPPPIGGIALHGGSTRRRHAVRGLRVVQNPHRSRLKCAASPTRPGRSTGWREKVRPTPPLRRLFREKVLPACIKTPNLGQFERAGRIFSCFHDLAATQGELFRACRRRPSGALPISDRAPQVWRAWEGLEGLGAVPAGGGAWPQYPQTTEIPSPSKFRMQFPHDTNRRTLKNRRISTIRFQYLKYTQGNCM